MRFDRIGVVGAGLIGQSWAIVFANAGCTVTIFDGSAEVRVAALPNIRASLETARKHGLVDSVETPLARITMVDRLEDAVADADYVQESVFERVDVKREISRAIGDRIRADAVVGSSSSGIPASAFTADVANRSRFLIVHPVNPPHLIPLVELVPAPWTDPAILPELRAHLAAAGQAPILVNKEVEGFVLNRLQGALLNEAWALFEEGVASAADIDRTVSLGLGLRWSFMGPFETIDLNAPGGIADYAERLSPLYHAIAQQRRDPRPWSEELIVRATAERREVLPAEDLRRRMAWRDTQLTRLAARRKAGE